MVKKNWLAKWTECKILNLVFLTDILKGDSRHQNLRNRIPLGCTLLCCSYSISISLFKRWFFIYIPISRKAYANNCTSTFLKINVFIKNEVLVNLEYILNEFSRKNRKIILRISQSMKINYVMLIEVGFQTEHGLLWSFNYENGTLSSA